MVHEVRPQRAEGGARAEKGRACRGIAGGSAAGRAVSGRRRSRNGRADVGRLVGCSAPSPTLA
eukprot:scaffold3854_cov107-Isochrysis_galbana.AAC.13